VNGHARPDAAIDATLSALAEPTRRRVVTLLRDGPRRASEIAEALGTSRQAMSRHLRVLREAGLLQELGAPADDADEVDARTRVYGLDTRPLAPLNDWLADIQAFWGEQLAAFKAHAEGRRARR
jgi:DNA-binding transcriptional ArsR family regulator